MSRAPGAPPRAEHRPCALITGGGSGGHVFPGLAVADELASRGWRVAWAGAHRGMEKRLVERRGLEFHAVEARPVVGRGVLGKARAVATLAASGWRGRKLVSRHQVRVVLGTGGYVSAPAVVGARLAGVPALLLEPNADAGVANRALSRLSREALVAHAETAAALHCPTTTTGVPVRAEFFDVAEDLPWGTPLRLLVLGGSQGATQLNRLLPASLATLGELGPVVVRHQTGRRHLEATTRAYAEHGIATVGVEGGGYKLDGPPVQVEVLPFVHKVARAMAESHLVVSRAGAITLAEICAAGRPSLLVPLTLAGGHQESNARRLAAAGAAEIFEAGGEDRETEDLGRLGKTLAGLLGSRRRLDTMAAAARALGRPRAAADIADRLEHWAGERHSPAAASRDLPAVLHAFGGLGGSLRRRHTGTRGVV